MQKGEFTIVIEGCKEMRARFRQEKGESHSPGKEEEEDSMGDEVLRTGIARCIQSMKKEGIARDTIMKIMQESFNVGLSLSTNK